ncbi:rust resistance kinase Lr10-like [Nymphaea colorata]|nr:rust resistance kinase Lr10-like [Nymphaea colorata]
MQRSEGTLLLLSIMTPCHLLLFFFFFFFSSSSTNLSDLCPPSSCGNISIRYPFHLRTNDAPEREFFCGYEGFGISCSNGMTPIFTLPSDVYVVREINYETKQFSLVDLDLHFLPCPVPHRNVTLNPASPLRLDPANNNFTFFINCSSSPFLSSAGSSPLNDNPTAPITCLNSSSSSFASGRLYAVPAHQASSARVDWQPVCSRSVLVPYSGVASNRSGGEPAVVRRGFLLDWGQDGRCAACEGSGGLCGCGRGRRFICFCDNGEHASDCHDGDSGKESLSWKIILGITAAAATFVLACSLIIWYWISRKSGEGNGCFEPHTSAKLEKFLSDYKSLTATRYTYNEVKRMTNNFKHKLGQGGYGSVFKGDLTNGTPVAVKLMEKSYNDGQEFINEVATIGRIHHVNVIRLLGFCIQGSRRALIYEFMANGSLEKFICSDENNGCKRLIGERLYHVALGIARGIEYLHQGCDRRIIHFDIKPNNILLDHEFAPKVSDFGLAKWYRKGQSVVTITEGRGTIGYIAPEIFYGNSRCVSNKSDVYSFGMLLLAVVGLKDKLGPTATNSSQDYFPQMIYESLGRKKQPEEIGEGEDTVRKITTVALWCIQWNPMHRPSMDEVIRMFESDISSLIMPPNNFFPATEPKNQFESSNTSGCSISS